MLTRIEIALALAASGEVVVRDLIGVVVWLRVVLAGPDTVDFLDGLEVGSVGFQLDYSAWDMHLELVSQDQTQAAEVCNSSWEDS